VTPSPHPQRPSFVLGLPERFVGFPLGSALLIPPIGFPMLRASQFRAGGPRLRWDHRDLPSHTGSSSLPTYRRPNLKFVYY